jgi:hypothetical protein
MESILTIIYIILARVFLFVITLKANDTRELMLAVCINISEATSDSARCVNTKFFFKIMEDKMKHKYTTTTKKLYRSADELISTCPHFLPSGSVFFTYANGARPRTLETYTRGRIAKKKSSRMFLFILLKKENLLQYSEIVLKLIKSELP